MIVKNYGDKIAGHVSRDSTAIEAREKPAKKEPKAARPKGKRGRRKKGEQAPPVEPKRLELQPDRSLEANLADLPQACNVGTKKNSKGYKESWIGYKLHADVVDGEIPVSLILTSASLHDSQVAIPLAQMTASRVTNLYDLMDAAYDAEAIHRYALDLGHVALIDSNPRSGEKVHFSGYKQFITYFPVFFWFRLCRVRKHGICRRKAAGSNKEAGSNDMQIECVTLNLH